MVVNPAGAVFAEDFGAPKIITTKARETISGGEFVWTSGATAVISSGLNSLAFGDIEVATGASGTDFTGIALNNAVSGGQVSVAVEGLFIVTAAGTIVAGRTITPNGGNAVVTATTAGQVIGRAYCAAGSEGYTLAHIGRS